MKVNRLVCFFDLPTSFERAVVQTKVQTSRCKVYLPVYVQFDRLRTYKDCGGHKRSNKPDQLLPFILFPLVTLWIRVHRSHISCTLERKRRKANTRLIYLNNFMPKCCLMCPYKTYHDQGFSLG